MSTCYQHVSALQKKKKIKNKKDLKKGSINLSIVHELKFHMNVSYSAEKNKCTSISTIQVTHSKLLIAQIRRNLYFLFLIFFFKRQFICYNLYKLFSSFNKMSLIYFTPQRMVITLNRRMSCHYLFKQPCQQYRNSKK